MHHIFEVLLLNHNLCYYTLLCQSQSNMGEVMIYSFLRFYDLQTRIMYTSHSLCLYELIQFLPKEVQFDVVSLLILAQMGSKSYLCHLSTLSMASELYYQSLVCLGTYRIGVELL